MTLCATQVNSGIDTMRVSSVMTGNDDEELQLLMEKELEALATVSQANRTLVQARQAVKDARATRQPLPRRSAAASARESERRFLLCRGPHLDRDCLDRNKTSGKGSNEPRDKAKGKKGIGKSKGFGAVTIATAFTELDEPERKLVRCAEEARPVNTLGDNFNPFEVYSNPDSCAQKEPFCQIGTIGVVILSRSICLSCTVMFTSVCERFNNLLG